MEKITPTTHRFFVTFIGFFSALSLGIAEGPDGYSNDFEKAVDGPLSDEFLILDGGFALKTEMGNRFIELPGAPLESYGLLFGPTSSGSHEVSVRIFATSKGRRSPTFGLGVGGVSGFKLQVSPSKKVLELIKGETLVSQVPFDWKSGTWTKLLLRVTVSAGSATRVEGKSWTEGTDTPTTWTISYSTKDTLTPGRATLSGSPFSGTPIKYDDLAVTSRKP